MTPECIAERGRLRIAQGRELRGGLDDGTVVLAQLRHMVTLDARGISRIGECLRDRSDSIAGRRNVAHETLRSLAGECLDPRLPQDAVHETQRLEGELVMAERARGQAAIRREAEHLTRTTTAPDRSRSEGRARAAHDIPEIHERTQGPPDTGSGHAEAIGKFTGGGRTLLEQAPGHALGGLSREFHNTIVAEFLLGATRARAVLPGPAYDPRMASPGPSVEIRDLVVRYGRSTAVDAASWTAEGGVVTAILGANGAGKTTSVEVACGLRRPNSGLVRLLGRSPRDPAVRARAGVMLQTGGLVPGARPLPWLRALARLYPTADDPVALLEAVGIDPATRTTCRRLSGGEQQRVKLAAALLPRPEVLFLDEPTAGLDAQARRDLLGLLRGTARNGAAIVLTTHQLADVEELADHIVVMRAGSVVAEGTLDDLTGTADAVRFEAPLHLDTSTLASAIGHRVQEVRPGTYVVHAEATPQIMASVASWCAQHGVMPSALRTGRQSLEDLLIEQSRP